MESLYNDEPATSQAMDTTPLIPERPDGFRLSFENLTVESVGQWLMSKTIPGYVLKSVLEVFCSEVLQVRGSGLSFMVIGKTGEGKSTLINSLVGDLERLKTSEQKASTRQTVKVGPIDINGVNVTVYDTQGTRDASERDDDVLHSISRKDIDLFVFCISLVGRIDLADTKKTIDLMTQQFGVKMWANTVIAFTYANHKIAAAEADRKLGLHRKNYDEYVAERGEEVRQYISDAVDKRGRRVTPTVIASLQFLPVGIFVDGKEFTRTLAGDTDDWLTRFWLGCLAVCHKRAKLSLMGAKGSHNMRSLSADGSETDLPSAIARSLTMGRQDGREVAFSSLPSEPIARHRREEKKRVKSKRKQRQHDPAPPLVEDQPSHSIEMRSYSSTAPPLAEDQPSHSIEMRSYSSTAPAQPSTGKAAELTSRSQSAQQSSGSPAGLSSTQPAQIPFPADDFQPEPSRTRHSRSQASRYPEPTAEHTTQQPTQPMWGRSPPPPQPSHTPRRAQQTNREGGPPVDIKPEHLPTVLDSFVEGLKAGAKVGALAGKPFFRVAQECDNVAAKATLCTLGAALSIPALATAVIGGFCGAIRGLWRRARGR